MSEEGRELGSGLERTQESSGRGQLSGKAGGEVSDPNQDGYLYPLYLLQVI